LGLRELGLEFLDPGIAISQPLLLFGNPTVAPVLPLRLVNRWRRRLDRLRLILAIDGLIDRRLVVKRGRAGGTIV